MRKLYLVLTLVVVFGVAAWLLLPGAEGAAVGAACRAARDCRSGICLPDADPREVARYVEIGRAYQLGRRANPGVVERVDELLGKLPGGSLTLHPVYPGVCTRRCEGEGDCPQGMFCSVAVWAGMVAGIGRGRLQVCMPDDHPAARLLREKQGDD